MKSLHVKNMVCNRCTKLVFDELTKMGLQVNHIELGVVNLDSDVKEGDIENIRTMLSSHGFELMEDRKTKLINSIKEEIESYIKKDNPISTRIKLSEHLNASLRLDYSYMSSLFSSAEGLTIEKYLILRKIELVKEMLTYDELSITEIAYQLKYCSAQYLSNQFKKITGLTPGHFKKRRKLNNHIDPIQ